MKSVSDKARRIIRDKRIQITAVDFLYIKAIVKSSHGTYAVQLMRDGRFNCQCENYIHTDSTVECSHILAVKMHPIYRDWFPYKFDGSKIREIKNLKDKIPRFLLDPVDLEENKSVDERLIRIIDECNKSDIDKFILRQKWIYGKKYKEIVELAKNEMNTEISEWYVSKTAKIDPREW